MAEISSTKNLDTFQRQFEGVSQSHEANAVERNGETFLTKGRGRSKLGRFWFALSHPKKKTELLSRQNFNVVRTLMKAAKNDVGPLGPVLVKKYLDSARLRGDSALTTGQVKDAVKFVKDNIKTEKIAFGVKQKLADAGFKDLKKLFTFERGQAPPYKKLWDNPQGRKILEFAQIAGLPLKQSDLQILSARVAVEELVKYLDGDASLVDKQNAFRAYANTYGNFGNDGDLNLDNADIRTKNLVKLANKENLSLQDMKTEATSIKGKMGGVRGASIVKNLELLLNGKISNPNISVENMDSEILEARAVTGHVTGNKNGLSDGVSTAVKDAFVKFNMYGQREGELKGEEAYRKLEKSPLLKSGLTAYLKSAGSKAGWHHHASNELGNVLKTLPKGGKAAPSALKLFHGKFFGQGAKTPLEVPANLKTRFENAMNGESVSKADLEKLVKDLRKALDSKTHELVVSELKTDKGKKDFVTALNGRGRDQKHFDGNLKAFENNLKTLKFLSTKPGIRNHSRLKDISAKDLSDIQKVYTPRSELTAINEAKKILANKP